MSTRSRIGMVLPDGNVRSIYCHSDGYPEYVGAVLHEYWGEGVIPLLNLGDLSMLGSQLGRDEGPGAFDARRTLDTDDPRREWCLAYGRDRGETGTEAITHPKSEWPDSDQEWEYLWTGREWKARGKYSNKRWARLVTLLTPKEAPHA